MDTPKRKHLYRKPGYVYFRHPKTGKLTLQIKSTMPFRSTQMGNHKLADGLAYPPRAMRADRAAAYLDMSSSSFLKLVDEGVLPAGVHIKGMVVWDRYELDAAFENIKSCDSGNSMHKLLGIKP